MAKGKLSPKNFLNKSKKNDFSKLNLNQTTLEKGDFSIRDLKNHGDNEDRYNLLHNILDSASASQVSDACSTVSGRSGVIQGLKPINNKKVYGPIFTAITNNDDWGTSLMAMNEAEEGDLLFIYSYGEPASVWGELASTCADEKGILGTILYGYARDIDALLYMDFPVYALDFLPNAGKALGLGKTEVVCKVDEHIIKPGDFIFADESGVVFIPQEIFEDVVIQTFNIKVKESNIIKELRNGKLLSEAVGFRK